MANIQDKLNNIKNALFGKDVRGSIHDGMDAINKEVENTTGRQVDLENTFDQLVINAGNSNAEIVDARVKNDGTSYSKLGDRLDAVDSQLEHIANNITIKCKADGITDDTVNFKEYMNIIKNGGILNLEGKSVVISTIELVKSNCIIENGTIVLGYNGLSGLYNGLIGFNENSSDIMFKNVKFVLHKDCKNLSKKGIVFLQSNNISFINCEFYNIENETLRFDYCNNVDIINCKFYNCATNSSYGQLAFFMCDNVNIEKNVLNNGGIGVSIYGKSNDTFSKNIKIQKNTISTDPTSANGMGIYILKNVENILIDGNFIENNPHENIVLTNISNPSEFLIKDVVISNNICKNAKFCDISLDVDVKNATVCNNVIYSNATSCSIHLRGENLVANDNILEREVGIAGGNSYGIHIDHCTYAQADNNKISGSTTSSIYNNQSNYTSINNNIISVESGCIGLALYPKNNFEEHATIIGNTVIGKDLTSILINRTGGDNIRSYIITNNIFDTGTISLTFLNTSIFSHNIGRNLDSSYVITENGNVQMKDNIGLLNNNKFIADPKPSYSAIGGERGRIVYIGSTQDQLAFVQNNNGEYRYNRIGVGVGNISDSVANDVSGIRTDFNLLLSKLRASGILT
ncbi:MAG TPA: right-handed parallel beta-helix repeat-containing protein [Romboutsia timonensis]|uniref:Right-handed parallel beta-helix repeat-containing protein n=1 Tax=Romboutsia timonensis TaxID=1776391 RepID=A0A921N3P7_9FIRM|nr:right-handed parallel beta-helix repeat-containing protein [Romboutsia timonensis]